MKTVDSLFVDTGEAPWHIHSTVNKP